MTQHFIVRLLHAVSCPGLSLEAGQTRHIMWSSPAFVPRLVGQARQGGAIEWGSIVVPPGGYEVIHDGRGPLDRDSVEALPALKERTFHES